MTFDKTNVVVDAQNKIVWYEADSALHITIPEGWTLKLLPRLDCKELRAAAYIKHAGFFSPDKKITCIKIIRQWVRDALQGGGIRP